MVLTKTFKGIKILKRFFFSSAMVLRTLYYFQRLHLQQSIFIKQFTQRSFKGIKRKKRNKNVKITTLETRFKISYNMI